MEQKMAQKTAQNTKWYRTVTVVEAPEGKENFDKIRTLNILF